MMSGIVPRLGFARAFSISISLLEIPLLMHPSNAAGDNYNPGHFIHFITFPLLSVCLICSLGTLLYLGTAQHSVGATRHIIDDDVCPRQLVALTFPSCKHPPARPVFWLVLVNAVCKVYFYGLISYSEYATSGHLPASGLDCLPILIGPSFYC